jgi:cell division protein FtsW
MHFLRFNIKGDKVIWAVVILLSLISTLVVYSATGSLAYKYQSGNTEYYLLKHVTTLVFGLVLMMVTHNIPHKYFSRFSQLAVIAAVPLLIYTLAKGTNLNEASRWIQLPVINLTFQTSDFAKLALIAFTARQLSKKQDDLKDIMKGFLPIVAPVIVICVLILPANFSTCAVLFTSCFVLMFAGRIYIKHLLLLVAAGIVGILMIVLIAKVAPGVFPRFGTWIKRIENFSKAEKEENAGSQVDKAKIAISTAGFLGKGPGKSTQRNFLPHPYSDFIYAIIVEEYGFAMGFAIVMLYSILLFRGLRIANQASSTFGSLLAFGLTFGLVLQASINMAVAVNLFPVTGQPLPLLSMGGTSIWFTSVSIGIILSVSREAEEATEEKPSGFAEEPSYA